MNIIFIGDIVGRPGRKTVKKLLGALKAEYSADFVIANGENSSGGLGISPAVFEELTGAGIDVITSGNHIWKQKEIYPLLEDPRLLRPANYPDSAPGRGWTVIKKGGFSVAVMNLIGRTFMEPVDCPFRASDRILEELGDDCIIIVDFHAEATSEKLALGLYLDGRVSAVIGTHTHVQTSDARLLPEGTGYITDAGMTGSSEGIIGVEKEEIIKRFLTGMPFSFKVAKGGEKLEGVVVGFDEPAGKTRSIKAFRADAAA